MITFCILLVITLLSAGVAALGLLLLVTLSTDAHQIWSLDEFLIYYLYIVFYGGWVYMLAYPVLRGFTKSIKERTAAETALVGAGIGAAGSFLVALRNLRPADSWIEVVGYSAAFALSGALYGLLCHVWLLEEQSQE